MKIYPQLTMFLLNVIFFNTVLAQKTEKYYDYNWKECKPADARYYSVVEHTDSGWLRNDYYIRERKLQMQGLFTDEECKNMNGRFTYLYSNDQLSSFGKYVNNKKDGLWLSFSPEGYMTDSTTYEQGRPVGLSLSWHDNGYPKDSSVYKTDGSAVSVSWFDNGNPSSAGKFGIDNKETGLWKFYHKNGAVSASIVYANGKVLEAKYFDDKGNFDPSATGKDKDAEFQGGLEGWMKYLKKNLYSPPQYKIEGADHITIVVDFIIDEEGNVSNVKVSAPFHPGYDKIAEDIIKKSPKWIPAIQNNRNIKAYRKQPVTFRQQ